MPLSRPSGQGDLAKVSSTTATAACSTFLFATPSALQAGIEASVGSKGDSYDNALAEAVNSLFKAEVIYRRAPWKSREAVELATLEWVHWFNNRRLLEPLGYVSPAEFEATYYDKQANPPMVVGFN